jgi:hypothetical protein
VFDSAGKHLRTFGRRGQGPGEFDRGISDLFLGAGDSLYVLDLGRRLSVFSPAHEFVRLTSVPGVKAARLSGAQVLVSGIVDLAGPPFLVVGSGGAGTVAFGERRVINSSFAPSASVSQDERTIWTWEQFEYRFTKWSVGGQRMGEVRFDDVPWLNGPPGPARRGAPPVTRQSAAASSGSGLPAGVISNAVADGELLWVSGFVYADVDDKVRKGARLEVVSLRDNRVLAARSVNTPLRFIPRTRLAYEREVDADGFVNVTIWRMQLTTDASPRR